MTSLLKKKEIINEIIYNIGEKKKKDSSRIRIPICTLYKVNYVTFFVLSIRMECAHADTVIFKSVDCQEYDIMIHTQGNEQTVHIYIKCTHT